MAVYTVQFIPSASGTAIVYSTYLGSYNRGSAIAVDAAGNAYVTGYTYSNNFPTTPGAFQTTFGGGNGDAFVSKLNPSGSALIYSTYLGGAHVDLSYGIAVDGAGNAYVTGNTMSY
ncbi:MAG TPA: SBBP repeat-containing protein, partial [Terriglobia bacterium]|nr:SBBP repeat-containing protein [Terriglobia bacterium]